MGRKINGGSISNANTLDGLDSLDVNQKLLPINIPDIDSGTF